MSTDQRSKESRDAAAVPGGSADRSERDRVREWVKPAERDAGTRDGWHPVQVEVGLQDGRLLRLVPGDEAADQLTADTLQRTGPQDALRVPPTPTNMSTPAPRGTGRLPANQLGCFGGDGRSTSMPWPHRLFPKLTEHGRLGP